MIPSDALKPQDGRYNQITLSESTLEKIMKAQNNIKVPNETLMKLSESIRVLEQVKTAVISPQLQQLANSIQSLNSTIVSVIQNDAMQAALQVGQQIAKMVETVDFRPMLKRFSEAMIPFKYIALLERLKWPVFLIDDEKLRQDILDACENQDDLERVTEIIYAYCTDEFFVAMEADWTQCTGVNENRKDILSEGLLMHRKGYYYASTSMLMCQVYGVAADIENTLKENGLTLSADEKKDAADMFGLNPKFIDKEKGKLFQALMFTESGILLWNAMANYLKDVCLFSGADYSDINNQPLRNKICHGDQLEFGTKEHSIKAILTIDMLIQLAYEINNMISIKKEDCQM